MKQMLIPVLMLLAASAPPDDAAKSEAGRLDGAWQLVMSEVIAPNGQVFPGKARESLLLFAGDYYSMNWATGEAPAPYSAEQLRPTDAEKVARYGTLIVNAGRFEAAEGVLTIHPGFAMVPEYVGGLGVFDYVLSGDTLDLQWHTIKSVNGTSDPSTAVGVRFHYKFTRLGD